MKKIFEFFSSSTTAGPVNYIGSILVVLTLAVTALNEVIIPALQKLLVLFGQLPA